MDPLEQARLLFFEALSHHQAHRLGQAETRYRQALALVPDRVSVLVNLSAVLVSQHRFSEALEFCERALALEPNHPDALEHLALCRGGDDPARTLEALDRAIAGTPQDAHLRNNRAVALRELGRGEEALEDFTRALEYAPASIVTLGNRASLFAALGRGDEALSDYLQALRIDPGFPPAGQGLVELLRARGSDAAIPAPELDTLLARAIRAPWARPQSIAPLLIARLRSTPTIADGIEHACAAWPLRISPEACLRGHAVDAVYGNDLLIALLENALVADVGLERLLATLRRGLLRVAVGADSAAAPLQLRFHCALARQCFLDEYIWKVGIEEQAEVDDLVERLGEAVAAGSSVPATWIAAVASYQPLHALPRSERLLHQPWPAPLDGLLGQQVRQPQVEAELRSGLPQLTPIEDSVSRQVQRQYEENPYPRWVALPQPTSRETLASYLRRRVPAAAATDLPPGPRIEALNAGCGTGQHPLEMAMRIDGLQLLAIDLSRASLAYAARMAGQLGVRNIRFGQADLLELGALGQRFDLVESSGVLHHLADPARGLQVLAGLLADRGVLRISLYSETARRGISAAREHAAALGLGADLDGIRRSRNELIALADDDPRRQVLAIPDFYSTSECRDLLFHVQEHRFTLPAVGRLLEAAGLELLGLELEPAQLAAWRAEYPVATDLNRLDDWDRLERGRPDLFAAMYTVWARQAARAR